MVHMDIRPANIFVACAGGVGAEATCLSSLHTSSSSSTTNNNNNSALNNYINNMNYNSYDMNTGSASFRAPLLTRAPSIPIPAATPIHTTGHGTGQGIGTTTTNAGPSKNQHPSGGLNPNNNTALTPLQICTLIVKKECVVKLGDFGKLDNIIIYSLLHVRYMRLQTLNFVCYNKSCYNIHMSYIYVVYSLTCVCLYAHCVHYIHYSLMLYNICTISITIYPTQHYRSGVSRGLHRRDRGGGESVLREGGHQRQRYVCYIGNLCI